jgi:hypothetical protein
MNAFVCCGILTVALGACGKSQSATPSSPTPATPTITERFAGTLPVKGQQFYSFSLAVFGPSTQRSSASLDRMSHPT